MPSKFQSEQIVIAFIYADFGWFCLKVRIYFRKCPNFAKKYNGAECLYYAPNAQGRYIVKKIICLVLLSLISSLTLLLIRAWAEGLEPEFVGEPAAATGTGTLVQAHIGENVLDIISRGDFNLDGAEVKVANRQATITDGGYISEGMVRVRTTILVDISTSMPTAARENVLDFIEAEIKALSGNEEIKLATFGDSVEVLQDFTSDRYDLSNAAKNIEFNGQASAIYDAINSTILTPETVNGAPCYYRTIVITDGVDSTVVGITKEELYLRLTTATYPIDIISVSKAEQTEQDKDLAALSRISNGSYTNLYPRADVEECVSSLTVGDLFWIRAEVPSELLDGSTRQVDVSNSRCAFAFDMKMSMVDGYNGTPEVDPFDQFEEPFANDSKPTTKPAQSAALSKPSTSKTDDKSGSVNVLWIVIVGGCVIIAAVLIAVLPAVKRKKNGNKPEHPSTPINNSNNNSSEGSKTEVLLDDDSRNSYTVKLSLSGNSSRSWTIEVARGCVIGRSDSCNLKFDDSSVSREQFKLIAGKTGVMLSNLSSSNITKVNNVPVNEDIELQVGDIIKFGRVSLSVDLLQKISGDNSSSGCTSEKNSDGKTMTIF